MSRKIEVDLSGVQTVDDLKQLVDDGQLTDEDVKYLFERGQLPKPVMRELDAQLGGHYPQPGLQDIVANTRNTGDIGAASEDDVILEDDELTDESDNPPKSRGGKRGGGRSEEE
jgi:hypothetical protein